MEKYQTLLYYCYSYIAEAEQFAADHLKFCKSLDLVGRIIVANEGLNGTVSGTPEACKAYMEAIHADERFAKTEFKIDDVEELSFIKMHCRYKSENCTFWFKRYFYHQSKRKKPVSIWSLSIS